jgi:hypothetical protein
LRQLSYAFSAASAARCSTLRRLRRRTLLLFLVLCQNTITHQTHPLLLLLLPQVLDREEVEDEELDADEAADADDDMEAFIEGDEEEEEEEEEVRHSVIRWYCNICCSATRVAHVY